MGCFNLFILTYELILGLHVFCQTGPPQRVDCLAPPHVCHMTMKASRYEGIPLRLCPRTQASLPAYSPHYSYVLSAKQGSCEYHFLSLLVCLDLGNEPQIYRLRSGRSDQDAIAPVCSFDVKPQSSQVTARN